MLEIFIEDNELFDEETGMFTQIKATKLQLEHSLISLQKWESKWHKPFLDKKEKSEEEMLDYIRCMTLTPNVDPKVYYCIPIDQFKKIWEYIENPMTATWFSSNAEGGKPQKKEIITAEIVYYWMIASGIPSEYRKWHLNQLLTLIRVINVKNAPSKKMGKKGILSQNAKLNAARRARMNSKG